ncbi:putative Rho-GTPase-activating protein 6 [Cytospora mali]|uniref:Rho-GTPase-activating protein 6 n=1 Tax=Cytospora mali TaxID=578113 RepID=A0A194W5G8_CYTMA|nr:putative Rho-GTPase-activating protein 6 [Valsa mali]
MLLRVNKSSSGAQSSATWTSTSGDLVSDTDEIDNRGAFVDEYNRLARKYGVRPLVPDKPEGPEAEGILPRRSWWSRTFRRTSSQSTENSLKRRRSVSHMTAHIINPKRDSLKDQDLQGLVRLCGKSFLYLPPEYAPGSLILPTCFRATAQYLVQHAAETRGVFRIPGSVRVVNELYEFYCADQSGGDVANTVRSPNLPSHINAGVHDVASTFKKFLAGLPGGILGSLSLFDALVAINSQLYTDLEFSRTKQTKIRARLIALAIGTLRSQFRRELICAVFGLLCLLGRAAETAPREDEYGRPLPTSDLMGYNALGIVFGPLLVGDILGSHAVKLADPSSGIFLVPASPQPKSKKERKKAKESTDDSQPAFLDVDKIHIANDITEMLVTNWRDVVRQMRSLDGTLSVTRNHSRASTSKDEPRQTSSFFRPSEGSSAHDQSFDRGTSEDHPYTPTTSSSRAVSFKQVDSTKDALSVKKTRPNSVRSASNIRCGSNLGVLSPPREESGDEDQNESIMKQSTPLKSSLRSISKTTQDPQAGNDPVSDEKDVAFTPGRNSVPTIQSPSKSISTHASTKSAMESTPTRRGILAAADTPLAVDSTEYGSQNGGFKVSSADRHRSRAAKSLFRVDASPERKLRHRNSSDRDQIASYTVVPGTKIMCGKSTMQFQPRFSQADSKFEPVKETPSRQSAGSAREDETGHTKKLSRPKNSVTVDQMDGTMDPSVSGPSCRGSIQDLRGEFERREAIDSRPSLSSVQDSGLKLQGAQPTKRQSLYAQPRKSSRNSVGKLSPNLKTGDRGNVKLGVNKVRGLAAIFDGAAKASPFMPTPGGAVQQKRRETAGVVSPYTSNPSPRPSVQSVTSVSTPPSLISHARNSVSSSGTAEHSGRKSMIPRRQNSGTTQGFETIEGQGSPNNQRLEESCPSMQTANSANTPYRLPTPSRLPLDDPTRTSRSPFKLTAQQENRPVGFHSSPMLPLMNNDGYKGLTHLSQHSTNSGYSEDLMHHKESSSLSSSPSRGRSASSLRDQIRSLRQELSSKNEECAQLRLELQESSKASQVSEIILREDLEHSRADCAKWKRRAERAERKVDKFERLTMRIKDAREREDGRYARDEQVEFSFISGPDHIDIGERSSQQQQQRLTARMDQSARRAPENLCTGGSIGVPVIDAMSDCSGNTVVRNINGGCDGGSLALWTTVDELVDFASPRLTDDGL